MAKLALDGIQQSYPPSLSTGLPSTTTPYHYQTLTNSLPSNAGTHPSFSSTPLTSPPHQSQQQQQQFRVTQPFDSYLMELALHDNSQVQIPPDWVAPLPPNDVYGNGSMFGSGSGWSSGNGGTGGTGAGYYGSMNGFGQSIPGSSTSTNTGIQSGSGPSYVGFPPTENNYYDPPTNRSTGETYPGIRSDLPSHDWRVSNRPAKIPTYPDPLTKLLPYSSSTPKTSTLPAPLLPVSYPSMPTSIPSFPKGQVYPLDSGFTATNPNSNAISETPQQGRSFPSPWLDPSALVNNMPPRAEPTSIGSTGRHLSSSSSSPHGLSGQILPSRSVTTSTEKTKGRRKDGSDGLTRKKAKPVIDEKSKASAVGDQQDSGEDEGEKSSNKIAIIACDNCRAKKLK
jgi:hypothetical protein